MTFDGRSPVEVVGTTPRRVHRIVDGDLSVAVYGAPIIGDRLAAKFPRASGIFENPSDFVGQLNGEFLVVAERGPELIVINDRFAAIPVFHAVDGDRLVLAFRYRALWDWLAQSGRLRPDRASFFEVFHFQRLFGDKTLDAAGKALEPATILKFDARTAVIERRRYWRPGFTKRDLDVNDFAGELSQAIAESIKRKTSDGARYGLLLSGGMDSRAVLAGFERGARPTCYTIGSSRNNEVEVAGELAAAAGARHVFIPRPADHYGQIVPAAVQAGGAMFSFQHGHFCGLELDGDDPANVLLHGHGFDYMFQGMYLPATRLRVLGRPTRVYRLRKIDSDLTDDYIDAAKYRLKGIDPASVLKPELRQESRDWLRTSINEILEPVRSSVAEPYDLWDYLNIGSPSRHYTYLNLLSADLMAEQRTVAFDNDILDLYSAMPARVRLGTRLLSGVTGRLDPALLRVRNANTNLRPDLSPVGLTLAGWRRGLLRRLRPGRGAGGNGFDGDPEPSDRSWPSTPGLIRTSAKLTTRMERLRTSERLFSLDLFDPGRVGDLVDTYISGNSAPGSALLKLITIDEFLSPS